MLAGMFERVEGADCSLLTRTQLEALLDDVASLESFLASRRLDAMGAIDGLRDGGLPSATVLRSKGKVSEKDAKQAARTAEALVQMPKTAERDELVGVLKTQAGRYAPTQSVEALTGSLHCTSLQYGSAPEVEGVLYSVTCSFGELAVRPRFTVDGKLVGLSVRR